LVLCLVTFLLTGCSPSHYRQSADKDAYAAIAHKARGVTDMESHFTIEHTNKLELSGLPVVALTNDFLGPAATAELGARILTLQKALEIAVQQSRTYQNSREQLYLTALSLTLAEHDFTPIFSAGGSAAYEVQTVQTTQLIPDPVTGQPVAVLSDNLAEKHDIRASGHAGVDWLIRDIGRLSIAFTTDFLRFLSGGSGTATSSAVGATLSRPLLRNAGFKVEVENLTQAQRDLLYELRDFVRFRKDFSVQIASSYYGVLGNRDASRNAFFNYQASHRAADRTRALAAEGRTTQTDLGRIEQQELSAESAWITAVQNYRRSLDDFKFLLGIPIVTSVVLDDAELEALTIRHPSILVEDAIKIGLSARLDYQNARDRIGDSGRKVVVAADLLKPQLDFSARAGFISAQEIRGFAVPNPDRYHWSVGVDNLELPLDRTAERNNYRSALISEQRSIRSADQQRDQIELQIRDSWRTLEVARRNYEISVVGVKLAERRVQEQELLAELGRAKALDQVDAQNALLSSKDQQTQALVAHTVARLQFWDNMGILYIKDDGQWQEPQNKGQASSAQPRILGGATRESPALPVIARHLPDSESAESVGTSSVAAPGTGAFRSPYEPPAN
jgi:outer membrane protein TolC